MNTWPAFGASQQDLQRLLAEFDYSAGVFDVPANRVRPADERAWRSPYANLVLHPMSRNRQA
ncbi:hypothetical protein [Opitutus sp. ER46]|uniref:hypothetical protein n=1 Tax=Opitutus sp. ER46 TaxID=2161864 RepID=UPI000D3167EC|nr:hypothetical protein [Opitutus sp. ER46]PTX91101.1 hypothetical protein DB354_20925 [Opitutus sp. ER46]